MGTGFGGGSRGSKLNVLDTKLIKPVSMMSETIQSAIGPQKNIHLGDLNLSLESEESIGELLSFSQCGLNDLLNRTIMTISLRSYSTIDSLRAPYKVG